MQNYKSKLKIIGVFFSIAAVAGVVLAFSKKGGIASVALDAFAKCLSDKQVVMYGAAWCPHCQNEKKLFGSSFEYVPYVECPDNPDKCLAAGIRGYPTWVFPDGRKLEGEQGLRKLSEASSCPLPEPKPEQ